MRPPHLREYLDGELEYPVDHSSVLTRIGETTVDAPDDVDSESIDEILSRDDDETYETVDDLFASVVGNLDDDYIGRKFYDDRGANIEEGGQEYPHDDRDQSF